MSRRSSRRAPQGEPYRDHGARDAYLDRLGVIRRPPSLEALTELQRAHVERVPYETIWLALGRQVGIDVGSSVSRILSGWGGYCFHLNGAFHWLLGQLGYDARLHRGGVQGGRQVAPSGATGEHAVITVRLDSTDWLVDVGLGSCVLAPAPLGEGRVPDPLLDLRLRRSDVVPGGWRLDQDPRLLSFRGVDFAPEPVDLAAFEPHHRHLSSSPESPFVGAVSAQRRSADVVRLLKGATYRRLDADGLHEQVCASSAEWWHLVGDELELPVDRVPVGDRNALWDNVIRGCTPVAG